jgi:hypothetical protein
MPRFVEIETPYAGTNEQVKRNLLYARACVRDCLEKGEIPFASHLLYTQPGITDDNIPEERARGVSAAGEIIEALPNTVTVVYCDLGISKGMYSAVEKAKQNGRSVEFRILGSDWESKATDFSRRHSQSDVWGLFV